MKRKKGNGKKIEINIISHVVETGDPEHPFAEECQSVHINGKKVKIPKKCSVTISHIHITKAAP